MEEGRMDQILELSDVSVAFNTRQVVQDINITLDNGQIAALIGPSGCGKTTLLRVVAGIIPRKIPATFRGSVSVLGKGIDDLKIGDLDMVFQEGSILQWRDAVSNVRLPLELNANGLSKKSPEELLRVTGLADFTHSFPRELSGGMKQRVNLASALITGPKLLLMDEPFANLDSLTKESMWQLVGKLIEEGFIKAALLVTHSIEEAVVLADTVHIMSSQPGTIVESMKVSLQRPRIDKNGLFIGGFGDVANEIRYVIRHGGLR